MSNNIVMQIQQRRTALGLSQKNLAELCGVPQSTIGRIESNIVSPTLSMLTRICSVLGLDLLTKRQSQHLDNIAKIDTSKRLQVMKCIEIAQNNPDIEKIIVFGSAARRECNENSDLDLCFYMKDDYDKLKMHYSLVDLGKACNYNCDLLIWSHIKKWFQNKIMKEGVIVYDIT